MFRYSVLGLSRFGYISSLDYSFSHAAAIRRVNHRLQSAASAVLANATTTPQLRWPERQPIQVQDPDVQTLHKQWPLRRRGLMRVCARRIGA